MLHLNQHTSRAIIFGPSISGGLDLPKLYTSAGLGQLRLLVGHLRLQNKTASLILIDIGYVQLLVGSVTLFFNLPFLFRMVSIYMAVYSSPKDTATYTRSERAAATETQQCCNHGLFLLLGP
jgi:hypothetical protein